MGECLALIGVGAEVRCNRVPRMAATNFGTNYATAIRGAAAMNSSTALLICGGM